ncbi:major facilitator superfamily [Stylonychia lemnae]|uniref:Major facilitator superfamily n=1 Tax=Stylonychia lemnae TaxID=5949 RepID=A0A078B6M1_STYLE|nr:major facilitator superfamily [Stylonychia lemnae]|eukprot:CDW89208.1 major facilitator superfamily [Stylonychia lemnae]
MLLLIDQELHKLQVSQKENQAMLRQIEKAKNNESSAYEELMQTIVGDIQKEFFTTLEKDIIRVSDFYHQLAKNIIREVNSILRNKDQWKTSHDHYLTVIIENLTKIGNEVIEIGHFIELNMTAIRKILKKFDKQLENVSISQGRELSTFEELKQPLLDEQEDSLPTSSNMIPEGLGSQHFHRMMMSKLKILKNTIDIMEESLSAIKFSTSFAVVSHEAQVMIDAYKEAESLEGLYYSLGKNGDRQTDDYNDESSEGKSQNDSSFNVRTLNMNELRAQRQELEKAKQNKLRPGGDHLSMNLLYAQAFLYSLNHFAIVPSIFEFASELGASATFAGVLLAMTPLATSIHAIIQNFWTRRSFKHPMIFGLLMIIISNLLYIYAYHHRRLDLLIISRFIFGFGGSKVVHRKYIANYILKQYWTQYYQRLIFISFLGMCFGPLVYLALVYLNMEYKLQERNFVLPSYLGFLLFSGFLIVIIFFFRQRKYTIEQKRPKLNSKQLFRNNTTSNYSLDSQQSVEDDENTVQPNVARNESEEIDLRHYNEKLRQISELRGFWSRYGSYIILLILKFMQKVTQDALIVILPVLIAISTNAQLPLGFPSLSFVCLIYSAMGIMALFINLVVSRLDLQYQDRSILLISLFAASFGIFFQIDIINQGSLVLHMVGFTITFIGIEIMEVAIAALTAKFTPPNLQKGLMNPSFLLTFAGTIGRTIGCLAITLADIGNEAQQSFEHITNYTFAPMIGIYLVLFITTNCIYEQLKSVSFHQFQLLDRIKRQDFSTSQIQGGQAINDDSPKFGLNQWNNDKQIKY